MRLLYMMMLRDTPLFRAGAMQDNVLRVIARSVPRAMRDARSSYHALVSRFYAVAAFAAR